MFVYVYKLTELGENKLYWWSHTSWTRRVRTTTRTAVWFCSFACVYGIKTDNTNTHLFIFIYIYIVCIYIYSSNTHKHECMTYNERHKMHTWHKRRSKRVTWKREHCWSACTISTHVCYIFVSVCTCMCNIYRKECAIYMCMYVRCILGGGAKCILTILN